MNKKIIIIFSLFLSMVFVSSLFENDIHNKDKNPIKFAKKNDDPGSGGTI